MVDIDVTHACDHKSMIISLTLTYQKNYIYYVCNCHYYYYYKLFECVKLITLKYQYLYWRLKPSIGWTPMKMLSRYSVH